jgi:hypothetical protein
VVPPDGHQLEGWATSEGVLHALAHRVAGTAPETAHAQATADREHDDARAAPEQPPAPLPGYHVAEITITENSPAAGRKPGDVSWPPASIPVSVLRAGSLHPADQGITLAAGDRVSVLITATRDSKPQDAEPPGRGRGPGGSPAHGNG